ncbi:MAG: arsenic metallochaperone ArsD family protein [Aeropyrum sp.]|nr:arsenic metallochaperone ArsD family protein [Aeropyrum sp.]MCE4616713.1 arsenic metallochaperone ArsD family protein [Aeropyrum sp.]
MPEITVYAGIDWRGRLAAAVAREAASILAREYSVSVDVDILEIPVDGVEAERRGLPLVIVDGVVIAEGRVPSIEEIVDEVFKSIELASSIGPAGFPVFEDEWEVVEEAIA